MRHCNPYATVIISLAILLTCLAAISGCRSKQAPVKDATSKDAMMAEEVTAPVGSPFRDAAGRTADLIADAAREQPSILSTDKLGQLHISGFALLCIAIAARFLFGTWRDAYIAAGLGVVPSVLAVLLTEYSKVVLLVPACGLSLLALAVYRRVSLWRTKAVGFDATATVIEEADTGSKSLGQLMKNRIAETEVSSVIDKALKPLEKLWKKTKSA